MTSTQSLINHYVQRRKRLQALQEECDDLRNQIADRLLQKENGFYGATAYRVKPTIVVKHKRRGYSAVRVL